MIEKYKKMTFFKKNLVIDKKNTFNNIKNIMETIFFVEGNLLITLFILITSLFFPTE